MDTKVVRQKYIDMLTLRYTKLKVPEVIIREQFGELCKFEANPDYRLKQTAITVNQILDLQQLENLTNDEARWIRDTWLY